MSWYNRVHERIIGGSKFASLPDDEEYCIQHHKQLKDKSVKIIYIVEFKNNEY